MRAAHHRFSSTDSRRRNGWWSMRVVNGKQIRELDAAAVAGWAANYDSITVDLGTGDGRFVRTLARARPEAGVIGVDLCAANLRTGSRALPGNGLLVIADALALPAELSGVASLVTVNFPWGSLLRGLLDGQAGLVAGLSALSKEQAIIEISLNGGALAEVGWALETGAERVGEVLRNAGASIEAIRVIGPDDLRRRSTTWAKRLAFGRDPRAASIEATLG
jgi:16S rRNA (adenine(1408)-N(1))-methyltransferase